MPYKLSFLPHRQIICLKGANKVSFLQGLVTNDVGKVCSEKLLYAALLTPQGRFLYDLFIIETETGDWLIECENSSELIKRLSLYKLRSSIELIDWGDQVKVYALWGENAASFQKEQGDVVAPDPRLPELGHRVYRQKAPLPSPLLSLEAYDRHRIQLGVADGSRDIPFQKGVILEYNVDELGGINWEKGCYVGQELMARTHHRGMIHKRLLPVNIKGNAPLGGIPIFDHSQVEVGELKSAIKDVGLAILRISIFENPDDLPLKCGQAELTPFIPGWLSLTNFKPFTKL